jgi:hypothetical protein
MKMKNLISKSIVTLTIAISLIACSKEESNTSVDVNDNGTSADRVTLVAQSGTWRITYFWDTDEDETSNFTGYDFTFNTDGTLIAVKGNTTVNGTWSVVDDSGNSSSDDDGNSTDDDDFNILFSVPTTSDFDDLNDDWDIISVTANKIELIDVSGGNGGTDFLTFEKN